MNCMLLSDAVDGFRLAYERDGEGPPVILLHGWPGNRHDYRRVIPLLADVADVVVPDLRGFGGSDKHAVDVRHFYSATAQAASVVGLINDVEAHAWGIGMLSPSELHVLNRGEPSPASNAALA